MKIVETTGIEALKEIVDILIARVETLEIDRDNAKWRTEALEDDISAALDAADRCKHE
jgi:hypothetical protein